ncbi:MAG: methionyl-tRNA formyltransferase [Nitriliruptorales bacterium]|nr:methionyl-tRNA formyltransferase [Nitriliruptorales bacterium]
MNDGPVRIGFFGTPDVAATCLQALATDGRFEVALVVTNPDRPAGRGRRSRPGPVKATAQELGVPVLQPDRASEAVDDVRAAGLDMAAVVAYGSLLAAPMLAATNLGFVNLHFSLLPRWRGAAPVQHAIRAGDATTGVTAFLLDEGMDTGPILRAASTAIEPRETAGSLLERLTDLGTPVLADALRARANGEEGVPQPTDGATLAPKVTLADVAIDWSRAGLEIDRLCRSADPRPGAHTQFRGESIKVFGAHPIAAAGEPGTIVELTDEGPVVACGSGGVRLEAVQPAGRGRMSGRDFANGRRLERGEAFGTTS